MDAPLPLLLNLKAGHLRRGADAEALQRTAVELGCCVQVISTASPQEMASRLSQMADSGAPRVAVAGGDGTIHKAVQVLANKRTELAVIPQGTANNFAAALRIPHDLPSALRLATEGAAVPVDLGKVCGEYFTETAGVGLFADALSIYGAKANKDLFRALRAVFKLALSLHASRVRINADGQTVVENAVMCIAANSFRMGFAMPVAPQADLADCALDLVILGDLRRSELIPYFRAIRAQTHMALPKVQTLRARRIVIESPRKMLVHADDRLVCRTPATIEVQPAALRVVSGPKASSSEPSGGPPP